MQRETLALQLIDNLPDAFMVSDAKGIITHWNAGATRIFGFDEAEALGQSLDIIIPPNLRPRHWEGYEETIRSGKSRYGGGDLLSVPALCKDGRRISVQFSIFVIKDKAGRIAALGAVMRDATADFEERKRLRKLIAQQAV